MLFPVLGRNGPSAPAAGAGSVRFRVGEALEDEVSMGLRISVRHVLRPIAQAVGRSPCKFLSMAPDGAFATVDRGRG